MKYIVSMLFIVVFLFSNPAFTKMADPDIANYNCGDPHDYVLPLTEEILQACPYCDGDSLLPVCFDDQYYKYSDTKGNGCQIRFYESRKGNVCLSCARISGIDGYHICYTVHSNCGIGKDIWCPYQENGARKV